MIEKLKRAWHYATNGKWYINFGGNFTEWRYEHTYYDGNYWTWYLGPLRVELYY